MWERGLIQTLHFEPQPFDNKSTSTTKSNTELTHQNLKWTGSFCWFKGGDRFWLHLKDVQVAANGCCTVTPKLLSLNVSVPVYCFSFPVAYLFHGAADVFKNLYVL